MNVDLEVCVASGWDHFHLAVCVLASAAVVLRQNDVNFDVEAVLASRGCIATSEVA